MVLLDPYQYSIANVLSVAKFVYRSAERDPVNLWTKHSITAEFTVNRDLFSDGELFWH